MVSLEIYAESLRGEVRSHATAVRRSSAERLTGERRFRVSRRMQTARFPRHSHNAYSSSVIVGVSSGRMS